MPKKKKNKKKTNTVSVEALSLITNEAELFINELANLCLRFCTKNADDYHFKYEINE